MNEVKELVEELRNKKSRDNRDLLDRPADMIEKLAKELCEKSGCHHKCHDTKDCVVEEEAEELFKQALVEGVNRCIDKTIEEAKKIEQIEEMARTLKDYTKKNNIMASVVILESYAEVLYNAGYRKQSEVIDEFAEKLKEAPIKCGLPLLGLSTKEEIEEYFNGIMLQVRDAIDNIAKKMKGGEE